MRIPRVTYIAIGVAAFAGLCASIALSLLWFAPQSSPADLLPAKNVTALFSRITKENARPFIEEFPQLASVPLPSASPSALALVRLDSGTDGWILFTRQSIPGKPSFAVSASSPEMLALLSHTSTPLSASPDYRMLEESDASALAAHLRFPALTQPQHPLFRRFAPVTSPLSMTIGSGGITIAWPHEKAETSTLSHIAPPVFDQELLTLQTSDGTDPLGSIIDRISREDALVLQGALTGMLKEIFGDDLSPRYDLLPLMEHEYALHLAGSYDHPRFVLRGGAPEARTHVEKLHALFAAHVPVSESRTHAFDDGFVMTDIRRLEDAVEDVASREHGWDVRRTTTGSGTALISALRGSDFILANDETGFARALTDGDSLRTDRHTVARGATDIEAFRAFLHALAPTLIEEQARPLFSLTGMTEWTLLRENGFSVMKIGR